MASIPDADEVRRIVTEVVRARALPSPRRHADVAGARGPVAVSEGRVDHPLPHLARRGDPLCHPIADELFRSTLRLGPAAPCAVHLDPSREVYPLLPLGEGPAQGVGAEGHIATHAAPLYHHGPAATAPLPSCMITS